MMDFSKTISELLADAARRCGSSAEWYSYIFTQSVLGLAKTLENADEVEKLLSEAQQTGEFFPDVGPPGCLLCDGDATGGHGGYCPDCL